MPPTDPDPLALRDLAERAARAAGALLRDGVAGTREVSAKSTPTDAVTEMDRAAERLIVEMLLAERPDDGLLGEEGAKRAGTSGVRWVIDPLDGTVNYLYRIPAYAVSIAAEVGGEAVAGAVYDPSHDELFAAASGHGATLNGATLTPSSASDLAMSLIGTGFGYDAEVRREQARTVAQALPQVRDIRRGGSAALDVCWVSCGRLDGYFERGVQHWDIAAAGLIVREAGGRTELLDDGTYIASNVALFGALRALVVEASRR